LLKRLRSAARKPGLLRLVLRQSVRPIRAQSPAASSAFFSSRPDIQGLTARFGPQRRLDNIGPVRPLPMWLCQNEPNLVEIV